MQQKPNRTKKPGIERNRKSPPDLNGADANWHKGKSVQM